MASSPGPRVLRSARLVLVAGCALALVYCGEQARFGGTGPTSTTPTGGGPEVRAPTVDIQTPSTANTPVGIGDSVFLRFRVTDDNGVVSVSLRGFAVRGDPNLGNEQVFERFQPKTITLARRVGDSTFTRYLLTATNDSTSELAYIVVAAQDSSGKVGSDTVIVRITSGPRVTILSPTSGDFASVGKDITIQVRAIDQQGVRIVGWRTSGVLTRADSTIVPVGSGVLPDTVLFTDTLTIPSSTSTGTLTITAFAVDSVGDPSGTPTPVTVTIQSAASDATAPLVHFTVNKRVEVDDSITVNATDASGILRLGFVVRQVGSSTVVAADSATLSGNQTGVSRTFALGTTGLGLDTVSSFPRLITVEAFAVDAANNRGLSSITSTPVPATGTAALDTLTIVAGRTFALPSGGLLADAVYNRSRNEIYFSNVQRDRIEVFNVGTRTFLAGGIPVGSRPWGLALWPRDTLGAYRDTVVVANSGGTNLSIVDVVGRLEVRRHRLPNFVIQRVQTATDPNTGALALNITEFDFADRPQFVATACRNGCANVFAVYSTSPTPGQTVPFPGRGYMAWEELTAAAGSPNGHFFYEHALNSVSLATDTLQIIAIRDTAPGQARRDTLLGAGVGLNVDLASLAFQDTTYVRNSGDFNHAIIGEGGAAALARAMTWDARAGVVTVTGTSCSVLGFALSCNGSVDRGISEGFLVRDFISNRASSVRSVATNFNGRTNFVRADSIYVFDFTLRQSGLLQVSGENPGMDVHPSHNFDASSRGTGGLGGTGNPDNRLMFAARPDANIEVFDTYFFGSVATLPIRDPVIGPLRLAQTTTGQVLIGVTETGIVVVQLTTPIVNPFPARQQLVAPAAPAGPTARSPRLLRLGRSP